jgi:GAF domain-containing protein
MLGREEIGRTQLAALLRASKRIHAVLDPAVVLQETLTLAVQEVDADGAILYLLAESRDEFTQLDGEGGATRLPLDAPDAVLAAHVIKTGETVNLTDLADDPGFARPVSARSALAVPLFDSSGKVSGAVIVFDKREDGFSGEDERFLLALCEEVALALFNARRYTDLAEDFDRVSFLYQVSKLTAVGDSKDEVRLRDVLLTVMNGAAKVLKSEACSILLWDRRRRRLVFVAAAGENNQGLAEIEVPLQGSIAGWVIQNKQSVLINDVQNDPRFFSGVDESTGFITRNLICAPMEVRGKIVGVLEALNKLGGLPYTEADLQLLQEVADHTARAIKNARRYEDLLRVGELHQRQATAGFFNPLNPLGR